MLVRLNASNGVTFCLQHVDFVFHCDCDYYVTYLTVNDWKGVGQTRKLYIPELVIHIWPS